MVMPQVGVGGVAVEEGKGEEQSSHEKSGDTIMRTGRGTERKHAGSWKWGQSPLVAPGSVV